MRHGQAPIREHEKQDTQWNNREYNNVGFSFDIISPHRSLNVSWDQGSNGNGHSKSVHQRNTGCNDFP
jgi:hypothetical protein